jgi:hypothetical protein
VVCGWLSGVAPRHPRRSDSPFRRLSVSAVSPSRRLFPPSIHRHHPQRDRLPNVTSATSTPARPNLPVSPVPHPLFLSFSLWRRDAGPSVSARVSASASPRRPASPFPRLPRSRPRRFLPSSIHRHYPQPGHLPTPRAPPPPQHHQTSLSLRLPVSPTLPLIDSSAPCPMRPPFPSTAPNLPSPSTQYPIPNPHPPICAKSPERYRAPAHRWWGRAGGMIV